MGILTPSDREWIIGFYLTSFVALMYLSSGMPLKTYTPRYRAAKEPLVTVAPGQFRFSAVAAKMAGLESAHWVRISTDESEHLIGFEFLDDPIQPEDANKLRSTSGSSRLCVAKGLINNTPWIKAVAAQRRKFKLFQYPRDQKIWVIRLAPWFELSVLPENIGSIGTGAGIYRYRDAEGEVVYIGKGLIVDRYREPARRMWDIARIEYSLVPEEDEQYKWEKFHLDDFAKEHGGRRPRLNRISGRLR